MAITPQPKREVIARFNRETGRLEPVTDDLPERALAPHYVVWIRPSRSIMPWLMLSDWKGTARVFRDVFAADEAARSAADVGGCCSMVATMHLPVEPSSKLVARLASGAEWEPLD